MARRTTKPLSTPVPLTLAFAGAGEVTPANIKALLGDLVGLTTEVDSDGYPAEPASRPTTLILAEVNPATVAVLDWSEWADIPYELVVMGGDDLPPAVVEDADVLHETSDVPETVADLLRAAREGGEEAIFVALWGEGGSDRAEIILDAVLAADLPAKDLTAGLDDLAFSEGEDSPEPASEPEPPKKRGRARPVQEVLEVTEEPLTDETQPPKKRSRKPASSSVVPEEGTHDEAQQVAPTEVITPTPAREDASEYLEHILGFHPGTPEVKPRYDAIRAAALAFAKVVDGEVGDSLSAAVEKTNALTAIRSAAMWANAAVAMQTPLEVKKSSGRPRADGSPAQARTPDDLAPTEYWDEAEQAWKPRGRGRLPRGTRTRKAPAHSE